MSKENLGNSLASIGILTIVAMILPYGIIIMVSVFAFGSYRNLLTDALAVLFFVAFACFLIGKFLSGDWGGVDDHDPPGA